ncbi:unnamed protein product [Rotaria sp. Silwood2]|nr:unnamed protein product [Rotaria sp. Silwood2]CAF3389571.1 unnamed protein product [Rotaria sp. Silwood2]CAF3977041.1 unnamed protein product [Rotaria sp. Silwood2]CAF4548452.1 unnamed protein product [Rotaria sp. Silwood2]
MNIHSYDNFTFSYGDNDMNEILPEKLIERINRRVRQVGIADTTINNDGLGNETTTFKPSTYSNTISVTTESTISTMETTTQSTIGILNLFFC